MGAWSHKALESDNGLDVIDFIKEYISAEYPTTKPIDLNLWDLIVAMKEDGLLGETFEDIDFLYDNSAMALAELYFMFKDNKVLYYESEDDITNLKKRVQALNGNLEAFEYLLQCLIDIKDEKPDMDEEREIVEIWRESNVWTEWKTHLDTLIARLKSEISSCKGS